MWTPPGGKWKKELILLLCHICRCRYSGHCTRQYCDNIGPPLPLGEGGWGLGPTENNRRLVLNFWFSYPSRLWTQAVHPPLQFRFQDYWPHVNRVNNTHVLAVGSHSWVMSHESWLRPWPFMWLMPYSLFCSFSGPYWKLIRWWVNCYNFNFFTSWKWHVRTN